MISLENRNAVREQIEPQIPCDRSYIEDCYADEVRRGAADRLTIDWEGITEIELNPIYEIEIEDHVYAVVELEYLSHRCEYKVTSIWIDDRAAADAKEREFTRSHPWMS